MIQVQPLKKTKTKKQLSISGGVSPWKGRLKTQSLPHYFCLSFLSRCLILEGTILQSEAAGGVTMNTIGAESIRDGEAAPGQAAVTGHGGADGKTATTSVPGAAMMIVHRTGGRMTGGTVAATGGTTTAGIGPKPTMTQTTGTPLSITGRTAVTAASTAAGGSTDGGGGAAGHSAAHLRSTAAGEPRV